MFLLDVAAVVILIVTAAVTGALCNIALGWGWMRSSLVAVAVSTLLGLSAILQLLSRFP